MASFEAMPSHSTLPASPAANQNVDSISQTIVFGTLGLLVAVIALAIAALQLHHMRRKKMLLDVFELA